MEGASCCWAWSWGLSASSESEVDRRETGEDGKHHGQGKYSEYERHRKGSLLPVQCQSSSRKGKAVDLQEMKTQFAGRCVQFVGMRGTANGAIGQVWRVTKCGVCVTFQDGHREQLHPEDIRVV